MSDIKKMTKEELLEKFEAIIRELEENERSISKGDAEKRELLYRFAISDARERLEQLKLGMF